MRDLTIRPDAAETMLEDADHVPDGHPMKERLEEAVKNGEEIQTQIPEEVMEDVLSSVLNIENFSLDDLEDITEVPELYQQKIDELEEKYSNEEIDFKEFEDRVEALVEEMMRHEEDRGI